jgi:hypothetical protein
MRPSSAAPLGDPRVHRASTAPAPDGSKGTPHAAGLPAQQGVGQDAVSASPSSLPSGTALRRSLGAPVVGHGAMRAGVGARRGGPTSAPSWRSRPLEAPRSSRPRRTSRPGGVEGGVATAVRWRAPRFLDQDAPIGGGHLEGRGIPAPHPPAVRPLAVRLSARRRPVCLPGARELAAYRARWPGVRVAKCISTSTCSRRASI